MSPISAIPPPARFDKITLTSEVGPLNGDPPKRDLVVCAVRASPAKGPAYTASRMALCPATHAG